MVKSIRLAPLPTARIPSMEIRGGGGGGDGAKKGIN